MAVTQCVATRYGLVVWPIAIFFERADAETREGREMLGERPILRSPKISLNVVLEGVN